jgi:hypothetical protein
MASDGKRGQNMPVSQQRNAPEAVQSELVIEAEKQQTSFIEDTGATW